MARPAKASLNTRDELSLIGMAVSEAQAAKLPRLLVTALPAPDFDPTTYSVRPATVTQVLQDGALIDLGDRALRVVHLPGHSPGSIALLEQAAGVLYSGDAIYDDELLDEVHGSNIPLYVHSMKRLLALDVAAVHPGHGASFDGERMREIAATYVSRRS